MFGINIISINLDGLELMSGDYYFTLKGLLNFDKNIISSDLYTDGQSFYSSKINVKNLVLSGFVLTNDIDKKFALNKILSSNKLKQLIINTEELGELYCFVEVKNRAVGDSPIAISAQLTMYDPYLYSLDSDTISLGAISNSGLIFPFTFPITFGSITGGQGIVTNKGNAVAYPIISIIGTCNNIIVTNQTTGESMSLNVSLGDSDVLIIDNTPSNRGIYLNGVKRMDLKNGSWLSCNVGDNTFIFTRNSLQTKQHCTVSMQSRWI